MCGVVVLRSLHRHHTTQRSGSPFSLCPNPAIAASNPAIAAANRPGVTRPPCFPLPLPPLWPRGELDHHVHGGHRSAAAPGYVALCSSPSHHIQRPSRRTPVSCTAHRSPGEPQARMKSSQPARSDDLGKQRILGREVLGFTIDGGFIIHGPRRPSPVEKQSKNWSDARALARSAACHRRLARRHKKSCAQPHHSKRELGREERWQHIIKRRNGLIFPTRGLMHHLHRPWL